MNSVVINPIGHIFAGAAAGVFRSMNDADQWSDVSSGLLPPGGNVWAVATGGIASAGFAFAGTADGGYFAASDPLSRCKSRSEARGRGARPTPAPWP